MGELIDGLLRWAMIAVSMFNMLLLLYLGAVVLLNAERRTFGVYLAGGSLLLAAVFFMLHTVAVAAFLPVATGAAIVWWNLGWLLAAVLPYTWYAVVLWYVGYWRRSAGDKRRYHMMLLPIATLLLVALLVAGISGRIWFNPIPAYGPGSSADGTTALTSPLLIAFYLPYMLSCTVLAIHALRNPGPTDRMMGEAARRRARPWMLATSAVMLLVGLIVGGAMLWLMLEAAAHTAAVSPGWMRQVGSTLIRVDLAIVCLLALATIFVGQAVVAYQVFTGRSLPHRGLMRQWRGALVLAGLFAALAAVWALAALPAIHGMVLAGAIMISSLAYFSRRSFVEHERHIATLRPFATGERFLQQLLAEVPDGSGFDARTTFDALCSDVLGTTLGYLLPAGQLSSLAGEPLRYPAGRRDPLPSPRSIIESVDRPHEICVEIDPALYCGASLAIPLYNERGTSGILLLGEKIDGGLYTQEEIEIARTTGERLIDTRATLEMARRLLMLQRSRMRLSQVADRRTRRALHDDVAPQIHAIMLGLSSGESPAAAIEQLGAVHNQISRLLREMPPSAVPDPQSGGVVAGLRNVVEHELKDAFDSIAWKITDRAEATASDLPDVAAEVVFYAAREALRNAARHGRGGDARRVLAVTITIDSIDGVLQVMIEDDGVGLGRSEQTGGSRQGLTLHSTMLAVIGGSLSVEDAPTGGVRVTIQTERHASSG